MPLLAGKVLGLAAAGLIKVGVYLAFVVAGAPRALAMVGVSIGALCMAAGCRERW